MHPTVQQTRGASPATDRKFEAQFQAEDRTKKIVADSHAQAMHTVLHEAVWETYNYARQCGLPAYETGVPLGRPTACGLAESVREDFLWVTQLLRKMSLGHGFEQTAHQIMTMVGDATNVLLEESLTTYPPREKASYLRNRVMTVVERCPYASQQNLFRSGPGDTSNYTDNVRIDDDDDSALMKLNGLIRRLDRLDFGIDIGGKQRRALHKSRHINTIVTRVSLAVVRSYAATQDSRQLDRYVGFAQDALNELAQAIGYVRPVFYEETADVDGEDDDRCALCACASCRCSCHYDDDTDDGNNINADNADNADCRYCSCLSCLCHCHPENEYEDDGYSTDGYRADIEDNHESDSDDDNEPVSWERESIVEQLAMAMVLLFVACIRILAFVFIQGQRLVRFLDQRRDIVDQILEMVFVFVYTLLTDLFVLWLGVQMGLAVRRDVYAVIVVLDILRCTFF